MNHSDPLERLWAEICPRPRTIKPLPSEPRPAPVSPAEYEASWHTTARTIAVLHQTCSCCGSRTSSVAGQFIHQRRRGVDRYVAALHFTEPDIDRLPLELQEYESNVQFCFSCILAEQLIEAATFCDLGHHQLTLLRSA